MALIITHVYGVWSKYMYVCMSSLNIATHICYVCASSLVCNFRDSKIHEIDQ